MSQNRNNKNNDSWIIIIGGGKSQLPFIARANSRGFYTLVIDEDPEAPGQEKANIFLNISIHDTEKVLKELEKYVDLYNILSCLTYSSHEKALYTTGSINDHYGLKGITCSSVNNTVSKIDTHKKLFKQGLKVPESIYAESYSDVESLMEKYSQIIIKPSKGAVGSAGVTLLNNKSNNNDQLFLNTQSISSDSMVVAQRFYEGLEFSIDGYVISGSYRILSCCRKYTKGLDSNFVIDGYVSLPAESNHYLGQDQVNQLAEKVVECLEIDDSFFSIDVIITDKQFVVIDVGLLLDAKIDRLLDYAGIDIYSLGLDAALGISSQWHLSANLIKKIYGLKFIYIDHMAVVKSFIPGKKKQQNKDGRNISFILEQGKRVGEKVNPPSSVSDTIGWLILEGEQPEQIWEDLDNINLQPYLEYYQA